MRSRPDLKVYLQPQRPIPGNILQVEARFESRSETPFDAIRFELLGKESRYSHSTSNGKTSIRHYHRRQICHLGHSFPGGILAPGLHTRAVTFALPPDAPPSYRSPLSAILYELSVRVDIPWWPDRHELYHVQLVSPEYPVGALAPRVYSTRSGAPPKDTPGIELSLASDQLQVGGQLLGALSLSELGGRKLRRIELTLATVETALVKSRTGPTAVDKRTFLISEGTPEEGASIPFRLQIPDDLTPAFRSPFLQVHHELQVTAVVAFGLDLGLSVPLTILRPATPPPPPRDLPLVGKARHAQIFRGALDALRKAGHEILQEDPEGASVSLQIGDTLARVTEEHREGLGPCLVASLEGPSLGLALRICERSWTDLGSRIDAIDGPFQKRFTVRCREGAQGAALLSSALRKALASFHESALDDESAVVLMPRSSRDLPELLRFFDAVKRLAQALNKARTALPPPAALAPLLPAYQRFARKYGASLCVGDLSLRWNIGTLPLTLDHAFDGPEPRQSRLWAPVTPRDPTAWSSVISQATERPAFLEEQRSGILLPASTLPVCTDPETVVPLAEGLVEALTSLSGVHSAGPYR
jgi:hypothetical protein